MITIEVIIQLKNRSNHILIHTRVISHTSQELYGAEQVLNQYHPSLHTFIPTKFQHPAILNLKKKKKKKKKKELTTLYLKF